MRPLGFSIAVLLMSAIALGSGYEQLMRARAVSANPVQGKLVDVGNGRRMQLDCRGRGSPTVVLEAGLDKYGSLTWMRVHDSLATTTRVCAYSRPGIVWSDPVAGRMDVQARARDLHALLLAAGESAPWVMVGHSLGGPYITLFTNTYPDEVAGLVYVDGTHPDQFARFAEATGKSLLPSPTLLHVASLLSPTGLLRLVAQDPTPPGWPREIEAVSHPFLPVAVKELEREMEAIPSTLLLVSEMRSLGDRPVVVLSAGLAPSAAEREVLGIDSLQAARKQAAWFKLHEEQARWSTRGRHEVVQGASHYIQLDRPEIVIRSVREVIQKAGLR